MVLLTEMKVEEGAGLLLRDDKRGCCSNGGADLLERGTVMKMVVLLWMCEGAGLFWREWRLPRLT